MAPVIPLLDREEVHSRAESRHLTDCRLKSLTQFQCEFETVTEKTRSSGGGEGEGSGNPRIVCHPFKRLFQQCISHAAAAGGNGGMRRKRNAAAVTQTTSLVNVEVTQPEHA